jgi:hypothetical protein
VVGEIYEKSICFFILEVLVEKGRKVREDVSYAHVFADENGAVVRLSGI